MLAAYDLGRHVGVDAVDEARIKSGAYQHASALYEDRALSNLEKGTHKGLEIDLGFSFHQNENSSPAKLALVLPVPLGGGHDERVVPLYAEYAHARMHAEPAVAYNALGLWHSFGSAS